MLSLKDHFFVFFLWVVFCLFVVYGSLVPFNYHPLAFDHALEQFLNMPYLDIGIESRQDWVANLVLYIPVSFGAAMFFVPSSLWLFFRAAGLAAVLSFSIFLAVGVLFAVMNPHRRFDVFSVAVLGLFAGFFIEVMQFFIATGISQGLSILLTMTGFVLGYVSWQWICRFNRVQVRVSRIQLVCLLGILLYGGMLMVVNWYGRGPLLPVEAVV